jgi:hypothetical protein
MDVKNQLTCRFSIIEDHAKIIGPFLFCNLATDPYQFADQLFVLCGYSRRPADMLFGNNQKMNRRLGSNVVEGYDIVVLKEFVGRYIPFYYFAEKAVVGHESLH